MRQKKRLVIISIGMFFCFSLLIVQYFKIQVIEGEKWTEQALAQHQFTVHVPFKRGTFYSNPTLKSGHPKAPQPLVFDVTKFHLYIDPMALPSEFHRDIGEKLETFIAFNRGELQKKSRSRQVAKWLDPSLKDEVLSWWIPFAKKHRIPSNALYFVTDYQRSYPFGKLLGPVLHTIQERKEETTQVGLPTGGLESYFNTLLKGKLGRRILLRSPLNRIETDRLIEPPEDGADIYLTIDHCIQAIVEEELERGVLAAEAKGGWAVMLDPHSGDVLALAQYPFFDPANYRDYFNDPEKIIHTKVRAVTDAFELGSIMKPITLSIALKGNETLQARKEPPLFDPEEKIDVTRTAFPGRGSRPLRDPGHRTALNMNMAIQKSSNVYMAQIVDKLIDRLGKQWYREELISTFGLGVKNQIELPGESAGVVPTPGKYHASGAPEWSTSTPYSLAMGYNLLATTLQMARAYSVLANGGYLIEPTLVREIVQKDRALNRRHRARKQVLESAIAQRVIDSMKFTTKRGGTGVRAEVSGYTEAGKTGTAEKIQGGVYSKEHYISSFVGFSPASTPRFVLAVTIDEPKPSFEVGGIKNYTGGRCAAPVFREVATRTLAYLGVTPDDPHGYPKGDPRYDPERADWEQEVRELKEIYDQWN